MVFIFKASASVLYVDLNSTNPTPPYANWSTAATDIQSAVDAASAGDTVLVTNGVYATGGRPVNGNALTNRVAITKPLTIQSVNGPAQTVIQGYQVSGTTTGDSAVRCAYLTNGATLAGFTLANGATRTLANGAPDGIGGGVWCESVNAFLTNCVIVGNASGYAGGGVYSGTLVGCMIGTNLVLGGRGFGGGAYNSSLANCTLVHNTGFEGGGANSCNLNNCLLVGNSAGSGGGAFSCSLISCTIVSNSAGDGGGSSFSFSTNCIVYYNSATTDPNWDLGTMIMIYGCTYPLPVGVGNITNSPAFVNFAGRNFRLQSNSPCINAGKNSYVTNNSDLDGNPRIVGGTVDIGAYEYQTPTSILSYAWAQQYGLPTDGTADFVDSDGDGLNNYAEWKAGTIPTNAASVLVLQAPATTNTTGITVTWQSVSGVTYYLQSSTNFPAFTSIQSNIVGQAGSTSYTDTTATNGGSYFYRVGVQ